MQLIVVGCSGSVSGPTSAASAYLVQAPHDGRTFSLLLDCGPGAFGALWSHLDPREVGAVGLSHLHPDHCLDLCAFYVAARYSPTAPWPLCPVYGPADTADRLVRAYEATPGELGSDLAEQFDIRPWATEQVVGPFTLRTARVAHPVEAYAVRVEETATGRSLVYSGDTGPCAELVSLARGAELLLVEAAFHDEPDNPPGLHLSGREAAEIGAAAGVGEIVLTHIPPWQDPDRVLAEAVPHFPGPVSLAVPGGRWTPASRSTPLG